MYWIGDQSSPPYQSIAFIFDFQEDSKADFIVFISSLGKLSYFYYSMIFMVWREFKLGVLLDFLFFLCGGTFSGVSVRGQQGGNFTSKGKWGSMLCTPCLLMILDGIKTFLMLTPFPLIFKKKITVST